MEKDKKEEKPRYTCNEYRMEMILLSLERRLNNPDMPEEEKRSVKEEIKRIKEQMEMT